MAFEMATCKITVIRRSIDQDLIDAYLDDAYQGIGPCDCFSDGQEIVIEDYSVVPESFCPSAWADIRKDILTIAMGANVPGIRQSGTIVASCADWFRPVLFEIQRVGDD